ncbi:hypothetical protein PIB30_086255, partial [Stylosanthes scabra]|nr:hypothetical protein [Stylosanthes scabra]
MPRDDHLKREHELAGGSTSLNRIGGPTSLNRIGSDTILELSLGGPNSTPKASSRGRGCLTLIFTQEIISLSDVGL